MKAKHILLVLILIFLQQLAFGQMEERFYFPSKTWKPLDSSLNIRELKVPVESDTLSALFVQPAGKPLATILFFHGGGGNVTTYQFMVAPLVKAGYQVYMVDFRSYGKSTGRITHANIVSDGQLFFDYVRLQAAVKGTRLVIFGASIGTQVATKLARDNSSKVSALILDSPMSSLTDIALAYAPKEHQEAVRQQLKFPYGAITDITGVCMPVLVVHAKEDAEVPFDMGTAIYNAAPCQKMDYVYTGAHLLAMKLFPAEYMAKINALLALL